MISRIILQSRSIISASFAIPHVFFINISIVFRKLMSIFTMGFSSINGRRTVTSHEVCFSNNLFKVFWIDTFCIFTNVIYMVLSTFFNFPIMNFIRETVGSFYTFTIIETSIAFRNTANPIPTFTGLLNKSKKSGSGVFFHFELLTKNFGGVKCAIEN